MKRIGWTSCGTVIVEMSAEENELMCRIGAAFGGGQEVELCIPIGPAPSTGKGTAGRKCIVCGEVVKGGPLKKCCSAACSREYAKRRYHASKGKRKAKGEHHEPGAANGKRFCEDCGVAIVAPKVVCDQCAAERLKKGK